MKVVLAHIQKPPFESRIFDKLAYSLSGLARMQLYILGGNNFGKGNSDQRTQLLPIFSTKRSLIYRFYNIWTCWCYLVKIKPDVVIICSPDLLLPAVIYKLAYGKRLIFDIQENFGLNLRFQISYQNLSWINLQDIADFYFSAFNSFADRYWLAEKIYTDQLGISKSKSIVFENKVSEKWKSYEEPDSIKQSNKNGTVFLFSGFITEESGILRAIDFFCAFQIQLTDCHFIISGYIPNQFLKRKILNAAKQNAGIEIFDQGKWVSTASIFNHYVESDVVYLSYIETEANKGKVPTKFFEAQFSGKPVLCQKDGSFSKLVVKSEAGFEVDFQNIESNDFKNLNDQIQSFKPGKKNGSEFVFDAQGLRTDFLSFCQIFSLKF